MPARLIVTLFLLASVASAGAQNAEPSGRRSQGGQRGSSQHDNTISDIRIYQLQHSRAEDVATIIAQVVGVRAKTDKRTNSLIVMAKKPQFAQVADILAQLDVRVDRSAPESSLLAVPIKNRNVNDLAQRVIGVFRRNLTVTADERAHLLLLRGDKKTAEAARNLVAQLDSPLPTATVEFAFFHVGSDDPAFSTTIPDDLEAVARQIERFGAPRLVGRMTTAAIEGEKFAVSGQIAESTYVEIDGRLLAAPQGGAVKIQFEAALTLRRHVERDRGKKRSTTESPSFRLQTTVIAQRGDYVVLGSAPHGWKPGESVVLVVHVPVEPR